MNQKLAMIMLTSMLGLVACGERVATSSTANAVAVPPSWKMEDPRNSPVASTSSTRLGTLSLTDAQEVSAPGWVRHTFSNGEVLLYRNLDGMAAFQDVGIAPSEDMPQYIRDVEKRISSTSLSTQSVGLNPAGCSEQGLYCGWSTKEYLWPNKTVYYRIPMFPSVVTGFYPEERDKIESQIAAWNRTNSVVKWLPAQSGQEAVSFRAVNNTDNCGQAYIGYQTRKGRSNYISINRNSNYICFEASSGTINHEMGHVVGLAHEQDRCDRDTFVTVAANTTKLCGSDFQTYSKFDYDSIMLYESPNVKGQSNVAPGTYIGNYAYYIPRHGYLTAADIDAVNGIYNSPYNPY